MTNDQLQKAKDLGATHYRVSEYGYFLYKVKDNKNMINVMVGKHSGIWHETCYSINNIIPIDFSPLAGEPK